MAGIPDAVFRRADAILERALDLPAVERDRFVSEASGEDTVLRSLVERLLESASGEDGAALAPGAVLTGPLADALAEELRRDEALDPGARVGPWRIVRELARGGMAVVYLVERSEGNFSQIAALKVLKRGLDTDEIVVRFEQERRILAAATHSDIARLLDGGALPDGRPWLALEYVEGKPIDRWCEERDLGVRERIGLFLRVARAVAHAHRNLVVHRDLKPSNILVSADAQPKLLDFGIAKILAAESGAGEETRTAFRMMTPAYASPEQVRGEPATTATDVWQLGTLLYLLLARRHPFASNKGASDLSSAILESEPEPPSRAEGLPPRWRRQLAGDLDTIVFTAMRKDPVRRYPSVAQLIDDLERYLKGRPVTAQPDTLWYRGGKLLRRHKVLAGSAAVLLVVLVLYAGTVSVQSKRITEERDRANREAETARQVSDFLVEIFGAVDPEKSRGSEVTARELLDRGAQEIDRRLPEPSPVRARLKRAVGTVYQHLGLYLEADALYASSFATCSELLGPDHPDTLGALSDWAGNQIYLGNFDEAERLLVDLVERRTRLQGEDDPATLRARGNLGGTYLARGRWNEAAALYERLYETVVRLQGEDDPMSLGVGNNLALTYGNLGRNEEAEEMFERVVEGRRRTQGADHPMTLGAMHNLAHTRSELGRHEEALALNRQVLAERMRVLGKDHPDTLQSRNNLALAMLELGRTDEALTILEEVLAARRRVLGPRHLDAARSALTVGMTYLDAGRSPSVAARLLAESLEVLPELLADGHPEIEQARRQYERAERLLGGGP